MLTLTELHERASRASDASRTLLELDEKCNNRTGASLGDDFAQLLMHDVGRESPEALRGAMVALANVGGYLLDVMSETRVCDADVIADGFSFILIKMWAQPEIQLALDNEARRYRI